MPIYKIHTMDNTRPTRTLFVRTAVKSVAVVAVSIAAARLIEKKYN